MAQCDHEFKPDPKSKEVKCIRCGDLDDEMVLTNDAETIADEKDEFYKTQVSFE